MLQSLIAWILPVLITATAALIDHRTGKIPNWLTLPAIVTGTIEATLLHGTGGLGHALLGICACAGVPWLLYRTTGGRAIGGGDVKLFGALGSFAGATQGLEIEFSAFTLLAVFALVQLAFRGQLLNLLRNVLRILVRPLVRGPAPLKTAAMTEMRMGPAIACAVLSVAATELLAGWLPWVV